MDSRRNSAGGSAVGRSAGPYLYLDAIVQAGNHIFQQGRAFRQAANDSPVLRQFYHVDFLQLQGTILEHINELLILQHIAGNGNRIFDLAGVHFSTQIHALTQVWAVDADKHLDRLRAGIDLVVDPLDAARPLALDIFGDQLDRITGLNVFQIAQRHGGFQFIIAGIHEHIDRFTISNWINSRFRKRWLVFTAIIPGAAS